MENANKMKKNISTKFNINKGFTLIELLVATSIFAVIAVGGISILLGSQAAYKRLSENRIAMDNINLVLDSMSREIKFGSGYGCINSTGNFTSSSYYQSFSPSVSFTDSITNLCNAVVFAPQSNKDTERIVYYLNTDNYQINEADYALSSGNFILQDDFPITSSDLVINNFWLQITGSQPNDYLQPKVGILVSGIVSVTTNSQKVVVATTTFSAQAIASQRILDN